MVVGRSSPLQLLAAASVLLACGGEAKEKAPVEVLITVTGDPGQPLEGANIMSAGKTIETTDKNGTAKLSLTGNEGDSYDVAVKCPKGFQSPAKPISIPLRRLADPSATAEYEVSCPPTTRTIVVAVRAENGGNLPVTYLGRAVGRTDASGAATILLEDLSADSQFELTLDTTSEKGNEALRPQNPTSVFTVKRADDVFTFDVKFVVEKKIIHRAPKVKTGPIALPTKINQ
jgi:hypothetical protein